MTLEGLRIAVGQVRPVVGDPIANLALADRWLARAARRGADLLVLPECFLHGYTLRRTVLADAEPVGGPRLRALAELARRHEVALVVGFAEANPDRGGRPFNSAALIERHGRLAGVYRKTHLFDGEHAAFTAGDDLPVFALRLRPRRPSLAVGAMICADIEYPEVARVLALGGARLLVVPSADMEPYRAQQAANLASRAIEENVYVALANTVDRRASATFFGGSGIAGPDGSLVSAGYGRPRLAVAALSDEAVRASGGVGAYLRGRRPALYRGLLDDPRSAAPGAPSGASSGAEPASTDAEIQSR